MNPAAPEQIIIRETLPISAQYGLLGVLLFFALVAVVYLVISRDKVANERRQEILKLHQESAAREAAVQEKRLKEASDYATVLAEIGEQVAGITADLQDTVRIVADTAERQASTASTLARLEAKPRPRGGSSP